MNPRPISFFEITCRNAGAVAAFYERVFGWQLTPRETGADLTIDTGSLNGIVSQIPDEMPPSLTLFVDVDDLEFTIIEAEAAGGSLLFGPMKLPTGDVVAMLMDPLGLAVGIKTRQE